MLELIDEILHRTAAGEAVAVCTVVRTRGSTPQKSGAVMLVLASGQTLGTIGGGCVEAEVKTRAIQRIAANNSALLTFKLDNDLGWDDGLVCGGTMDVAIEIIDSTERANDLRSARTKLAAGEEALLVLRVPDEQGNFESFERTLEPAPTLLIAGAGHVGTSLASVAILLGYRVVVIDDRADLTSSIRFPDCTCIVGSIDDELSRFPITPHTYVVIVTRGHKHDGRALAAVVNSSARYVGLIGSKRKIVTIFDELHRQGVSRERLERVHAPIGLNIGAVTPAEIAVSISAELVAVRRNSADKPAGAMRLTSNQVQRIVGVKR